MKLFSKPMLAIAAFLFATSANALVIEISETADFSGVVVSKSDTNNDGQVDIDSPLGAWFVNFIVGISDPILGTEHIDKMDLFSLNITGLAAGTLYVRITDTDFIRNQPRYITGFGGTTDGTVSFQSYVDTTNTAFGQGTLVSDSGPVQGLAFSGEDAGALNFSGPYSMSIYATVTHSGGGQATSFDYAIAVPEPGALALLGIGLLGLGLSHRRKTAAVNG